jgi:hypothetical protein
MFAQAHVYADQQPAGRARGFNGKVRSSRAPFLLAASQPHGTRHKESQRRQHAQYQEDDKEDLEDHEFAPDCPDLWLQMVAVMIDVRLSRKAERSW